MDYPEFGLQGVAGPADFSGEYNSLLFVIRQVLNKTSIAALVKVIAVNGGGVNPVGFVDVQPLVNQVDGYGKAIPQGVLHNIPYLRLQGGVHAVILDPRVGDIGIAVFADRDISSVKATKAQAPPGSRRRFDVADGLYLGGVLNGTPVNYIQFLEHSIEVVSSEQVNVTSPLVDVNAATKVTVTSPLVDVDAATKVNINSPWINLSSWVGMIAPFAMSAVPSGWLACPTSQTLVSTTTYAALFAAIGYAWGGSGGSFGLPYFASGYVPVQGSPGVLTHGNNLAHTHQVNTSAGGSPGYRYNLQNLAATEASGSSGGPDNLAAGRGVQWCVKY